MKQNRWSLYSFLGAVLLGLLTPFSALRAPQETVRVEAEAECGCAPCKGRKKGCCKLSRRDRAMRRRCCGTYGTGPYTGLGTYEPYWYGPGWRQYYWGPGPAYWGYSYPYRGYYYSDPRFGVWFTV